MEFLCVPEPYHVPEIDNSWALSSLTDFLDWQRWDPIWQSLNLHDK